jgi:hypothetical protein
MNEHVYFIPFCIFNKILLKQFEFISLLVLLIKNIKLQLRRNRMKVVLLKIKFIYLIYPIYLFK